jgi:hypothetical protein
VISLHPREATTQSPDKGPIHRPPRASQHHAQTALDNNTPLLSRRDWVTTAHQQARAAEATLAAAVTRARQTGATWSVIGAQLGISRQGAQQRFTRIRT